jgi:hypothetical protein
VVTAAQQPTPQPSPSATPSKDSYIRRNSIGYKDSPTDVSNRIPFRTRDISELVGERFIFMPKQTSLQEYGYQFYEIFNKSVSLPYQDYVGKIVKVLAVTPSKHKIEELWEVYLQVEGTDEKLMADAYRETIKDLANLQDIDDARAQYLGKTLRYTKSALGRYNAVTDKRDLFFIPRDSLVKVTAIVASWDESAPVRFVVKTPTGKEGFVDVNMSGTNIPKTLREFNRFNNTFALPN